jgi:adenylosuccinate lyase
METFDAVSPLDYRYYGENKQLFELLKPFVSEGSYIEYLAKVEGMLVKAMAKKGICSQCIAEEVERACIQVTPVEVYKEEQRIQHNIRALVNCIKAKISRKAQPYVHLFATSADIMDTASALRFKDLTHKVLIPQLLELERLLIKLARQGSDTVQMGRTHGQHAVPITFGFALAEYVSRLGNRIEAIKAAAENLRGQLSGAVGAYNAPTLVSQQLKIDPEDFEREFLGLLGLRPATHSTQICEPEYVADLAYAVTSCFSVLACLADDMRHLQRSEIGEIGEQPAKDQVGSSTMPHKVNPKDFENVKSLWKAFMPRMNTVFMDQLSEHQRDLTNSASSRFLMELMVGFTCAANRLTSALAKIRINEPAMSRNVDQSKDLCVAEALYTLLAVHGHPDAHEYVRQFVRRCQQKGVRPNKQMWEEKELQPYFDKLTAQQKDVLVHPEKYVGIARQKAESVCAFWEKRLFGAAT